MITLPFLLRQPTVNGCLPTAVRAVLLWVKCEESPDDCEEHLVSQSEIAKICRQDKTVFGCDWDIALPALKDAYSVDILSGDDAAIRDIVLNRQDPQPVIVIIGDRSSTTSTHAVAILDITTNLQRDNAEVIVFYDPDRGTIREMNGIDFWPAWSLGGELAFTIQP